MKFNLTYEAFALEKTIAETAELVIEKGIDIDYINELATQIRNGQVPALILEFNPWALGGALAGGAVGGIPGAMAGGVAGGKAGGAVGKALNQRNAQIKPSLDAAKGAVGNLVQAVQTASQHDTASGKGQEANKIAASLNKTIGDLEPLATAIDQGANTAQDAERTKQGGIAQKVGNVGKWMQGGNNMRTGRGKVTNWLGKKIQGAGDKLAGDGTGMLNKQGGVRQAMNKMTDAQKAWAAKNPKKAAAMGMAATGLAIGAAGSFGGGAEADPGTPDAAPGVDPTGAAPTAAPPVDPMTRSRFAAGGGMESQGTSLDKLGGAPAQAAPGAEVPYADRLSANIDAGVDKHLSNQAQQGHQYDAYWDRQLGQDGADQAAATGVETIPGGGDARADFHQKVQDAGGAKDYFHDKYNTAGTGDPVDSSSATASDAGQFLGGDKTDGGGTLQQKAQQLRDTGQTSGTFRQGELDNQGGVTSSKGSSHPPIRTHDPENEPQWMKDSQDSAKASSQRNQDFMDRRYARKHGRH